MQKLVLSSEICVLRKAIELVGCQRLYLQTFSKKPSKAYHLQLRAQ